MVDSFFLVNFGLRKSKTQEFHILLLILNISRANLAKVVYIIPKTYIHLKLEPIVSEPFIPHRKSDMQSQSSKPCLFSGVPPLE